MSASEQRAQDLLSAYGLSLDLQLSQRGSCLPNGDEELRGQVEAMLRDLPAQELHRLGLDPLAVMEEALSWARPRARLRGLAGAFRVLEHAALNLHVCPWRKEYKIIKTYSSAFIHHICPVLPPPRVQALFGLLGYRAAASRPEQLRLMSPRDGPAPPERLLRLACAFFLARCECCLLLAALGKHGGEPEWELSLVRERRRGLVLQVAMDNTTKSLDAGPPPMDTLDGEVDLYGDECPADEPSERRACGESRSDGERHCSSLDVCWVDGHGVDGHGVDGHGVDGLDGDPVSLAPQPAARPFSFHGCCDLNRPDPRLLCPDCHAFHSDSCQDGEVCLRRHGAKPLGACVCGQASSREPLILCRYCGAEYCRECWYRNPITCHCGQTFDQSSSV